MYKNAFVERFNRTVRHEWLDERNRKIDDALSV
jgi:hypothetical protein